uniref:Uncharacterized protein n=1 Tax=Gorilla gorilla gorilla TaxID=9595 RepID=A0A2I2ZJV7_GORGO
MLKPHSEARAAFIQTQQLHAAMADTFLEHMCCLDTDSPPITAWSTGIICTMVPYRDHQERVHSHGKLCF